MMELKNRRVLVVGLGKSGLAAALFLHEKWTYVHKDYVPWFDASPIERLSDCN